MKSMRFILKLENGLNNKILCREERGGGPRSNKNLFTTQALSRGDILKTAIIFKHKNLKFGIFFFLGINDICNCLSPGLALTRVLFIQFLSFEIKLISRVKTGGEERFMMEILTGPHSIVEDYLLGAFLAFYCFFMAQG